MNGQTKVTNKINKERVFTDNKGIMACDEQMRERLVIVPVESEKSATFDPIFAGIENATNNEYTLRKKETKLREWFDTLDSFGSNGTLLMTRMRLENPSFMEKLSFLNDDAEWKACVLNILKEYAYKL